MRSACNSAMVAASTNSNAAADHDDQPVEIALPRQAIDSRPAASATGKNASEDFECVITRKPSAAASEREIDPAARLDCREQKQDRRHRAHRARDVLMEIKSAPIADQRRIGLARLMDGLRQKRNGNPVHDQNADQNIAPKCSPRSAPIVSMESSTETTMTISRPARRNATPGSPAQSALNKHQPSSSASDSGMTATAFQPRWTNAAATITREDGEITDLAQRDRPRRTWARRWRGSRDRASRTATAPRTPEAAAPHKPPPPIQGSKRTRDDEMVRPVIRHGSRHTHDMCSRRAPPFCPWRERICATRARADSGSLRE